MATRPHDPLHLDVAAFASDGGRLGGHWLLAELPRLAQSQAVPADVAPPAVQWQVRGEKQAVTGGEPRLWLHLSARCMVWLGCQRCLQPFATEIRVDSSIRFVRDEAEAERLDVDSEHDVLALCHSLDLRELFEDELLLALPLVPRHEQCPQPLNVADTEALPEQAGAAPAHPFAVLTALKPPPKA